MTFAGPKAERPCAPLLFVALVVCALSAGCQSLDVGPYSTLLVEQPSIDAPRELDKATLPRYTVEPPDILSIDAVNLIPKAPYRLKPLDALQLAVRGTLPDEPIEGAFALEPGGIINLGPPYGAVNVLNMTTEEARVAIEEHLRQFVVSPQVTVALGSIAAMQQVAGELLVGPDGTVTLGAYGSVSVVGKTLEETKAALECHLAQFFDEPVISVSVFAYNSRTYYVVTQGAGLGDSVARFPYTGNETVMDTISQISGLSNVSSARIWVARPGRNEAGYNQILPVDWLGITQRGEVETNYQVFPGDRIYIAEDKMVAFDTWFGKLTAPFERAMGFTLLGTGTATRLSGKVLKGGGARNSQGVVF